MMRIFTVTAIINFIVGILACILFIAFGGFDLYLGAGTPKWLCWIPSLFFLCSGFNIISAIRLSKENKKNKKA